MVNVCTFPQIFDLLSSLVFILLLGGCSCWLLVTKRFGLSCVPASRRGKLYVVWGRGRVHWAIDVHLDWYVFYLKLGDLFTFWVFPP